MKGRPPCKRYDIIETFLLKVTTREGTRHSYRNLLNYYFKVLGVNDPETYFTTGRDYIKDVEKVVFAMEKRPSNSQSCILSCVKRFLERNDIEIKKRLWEDWITRNGIKEKYAIAEDKVPPKDGIRQILQHTSLMMRAYALFLVSTGCRPDEALKLKRRDVDFDNLLVTISADIAKKRRKRRTFMSQEASEAIKEWEKERDVFLQKSFNKSGFKREQMRKIGITNANDCAKKEDRLFPVSNPSVIRLWGFALEKAGAPWNEKDTNPKLGKARYKYRLYTLRKYWFRAMSNADVNPTHRDFMGGHGPWLNETYAKLFDEPDKLKPSWNQASESLSIYHIQPDLPGIQSQIDDLKKQNQELKEENDELRKQWDMWLIRQHFIERVKK